MAQDYPVKRPWLIVDVVTTDMLGSYRHFAENEFADRCFDIREDGTICRCHEDDQYDPSILDSVLYWLLKGNAVESCGTYENYLLCVVSIITMWADRNHPDPYSASGFFESMEHRGPDRDGNYLPVFDESTPVARLDIHPWAHPALSRSTWDIASADSRRKQKVSSTN